MAGLDVMAEGEAVRSEGLEPQPAIDGSHSAPGGPRGWPRSLLASRAVFWLPTSSNCCLSITTLAQGPSEMTCSTSLVGSHWWLLWPVRRQATLKVAGPSWRIPWSLGLSPGRSWRVTDVGYTQLWWRAGGGNPPRAAS